MLLLGAAVLPGLARTAGADINVTINDTLGGYTAGQFLQGSLIIESDEEISNETFVVAYIDNAFADSRRIGDLFATGRSAYQPEPFSYTITATGINSWTEFPAVDVEYVISATGTLSGDPWSWTSPAQQGAVSNQKRGNNFNAGVHGSIAQGSDFVGTAGVEDLAWTVADNWSATATGPDRAVTTMRMACYKDSATESGFPWPLKSDGWARVEVVGNRLTFQPGQSYCDYNLGPFDERSFTDDRKLFVNPDELDAAGNCIDQTASEPVCGGVYRKDISQGNTFALISPAGVEFFPETNMVRVLNCVTNPNTVYFFTFLPPNGEFLCAYTDYSRQGSAPWTDTENVTSEEVGEVTIDAPVVVDHSTLAPPPCPAGTEGCTTSTPAYQVTKTSGSDQITVDLNESALTATVSTTSRTLRSSFVRTIGFGEFLNLNAPAETGNHLLRFDLTRDGQLIASGSQTIVTCEDSDRDGFCGVADCNDNNSASHIGALERCNGADDNCNQQTDEGYAVNQSCNNWPGSICGGATVCSADGLGVVCQGAQHNPGDLEEICGDKLDNDCDSLLDEAGEIAGETCITFCTDGVTRPGGNDRGICRSVSTCINGEWSAPVAIVGPAAETCNNRDDNCDGIVDNVGVASGIQSTPQETACGCTGGKPPVAEACNAVDDNCNGLIDDGIVCDAPVSQDTCTNQQLDPGEEGVDCGGRCIETCGPAGEAPKKSSGLLMIGGGIVILIGVVAFILFRMRMQSGS